MFAAAARPVRVTPPTMPATMVVLLGLLCLGLWSGASPATAQAPATPSPGGTPRAGAPLFSDDTVLELTLVADLEALDGDRDESPRRPGTLTVPAGDGGTVELSLEVETRGAFRRDPANCSFPPLRLHLGDADASGTPFEGQGSLKLVSSCRPERASWDELVLAEYLTYRMALLVLPASFQVRLVRMTFEDVNGSRAPSTRPAFLIEDDDAMAERLGMTAFELEEGKVLPIQAFEPLAAVRTAIFEYMVGNTDWSEVSGHNVQILDRGGVAVAVPYDFDTSGMVDPPYATINPDFRLSSVRERYYRGWCQSPLTTRAALDTFRGAREEILSLWGTFDGLSDETRRRAESYLEEFFDGIQTDERARRRFLRDCRPIAAP